VSHSSSSRCRPTSSSRTRVTSLGHVPCGRTAAPGGCRAARPRPSTRPRAGEAGPSCAPCEGLASTADAAHRRLPATGAVSGARAQPAQSPVTGGGRRRCDFGSAPRVVGRHRPRIRTAARARARRTARVGWCSDGTGQRGIGRDRRDRGCQRAAPPFHEDHIGLCVRAAEGKRGLAARSLQGRCAAGRADIRGAGVGHARRRTGVL
jgi:hypothetical protein